MKTNIEKDQSEEAHPWLWYAPKGCTVLVIGTFPTAMKNRAFDFFYPNLRNLFWKIMEHLSGLTITANEGLSAVEQRKDILRKLKVAVTDMGYKISREKGSSLDARLTAISYMDIFKILDENKAIVKIILTSSSGKASAFGWFKKYLEQESHTAVFNVQNLPFRGEMIYKEKKINIIVVPSTSPAAAIGFERLSDIYYKELIT